MNFKPGQKVKAVKTIRSNSAQAGEGTTGTVVRMLNGIYVDVKFDNGANIYCNYADIKTI